MLEVRSLGGGVWVEEAVCAREEDVLGHCGLWG